MMKKLLLAAAVAVNLVGCASVQMADTQQDAAAKQFKVAADKAGVYVYRNESIGAAIKMDVLVDDKPVGQTAANTYIYTEVKPGKHTVTSKSENTDTVEIDAKPGLLYFIWQEVKMGVLYARTKLHVVSEADGKKGVNETKRVATP